MRACSQTNKTKNNFFFSFWFFSFFLHFFLSIVNHPSLSCYCFFALLFLFFLNQISISNKYLKSEITFWKERRRHGLGWFRHFLRYIYENFFYFLVSVARANILNSLIDDEINSWRYFISFSFRNLMIIVEFSLTLLCWYYWSWFKT